MFLCCSSGHTCCRLCVCVCVCVCHCVVKALAKVCPAGGNKTPKRKQSKHETFRLCFVSTDPVTIRCIPPDRSALSASLSCLVLRSRRRCGRWLLPALSPSSIRVNANVNKWTDNRRRPTCATHSAQNNAMSSAQGDTPPRQAAPLSLALTESYQATFVVRARLSHEAVCNVARLAENCCDSRGV
jgi:hypothetical protein